MNLNWIVTMHKSIRDTHGDFDFLASRRYDGANGWLGTRRDRPADSWGINSGFAFEISHKPCEKKWHEENEVIYFEVTSDGATGEEWIKRLEKQGFKLNRWTKELLLSKSFKATTGITYEVAVLKGDVFTSDNRSGKKIRNEAAKQKFKTPNPELACLIREMFSDEDMEAMRLRWIVVMHKSIKDFDDTPGLLCADRDDTGNWLHAFFGESVHNFGFGHGFAFEVSHRPA